LRSSTSEERRARLKSLPELPEVEVTRRAIEPLLVGRRVSSVATTRRSYFFSTPPATLAKKLTGRRVDAIDRHGKYLIARLDDGSRLLLHLGMTGQLFGAGASSVRLLARTARAALSPSRQRRFEPDRHTHLRLTFTDGGPDVLFRDVRKFGKVEHIPAMGVNRRLEKLGVDALGVTAELLHAAARRRRAAIKSLLLDQTVIAGIGNIYADESCFFAGIRPTRSARRLSLGDCERLARAIRRVLRRSIATGGSSISDFVQPDGADGRYQDERRVYGRAGEPCRVCDGPIRRLTVAQRSTHFCPHCQR
jgi:formamidopyrimidine-DNA glycosylase